MGIRIQVVAGYALTDVQNDGEKIADHRINSGSCLVDLDRMSPTFDEHGEWLDARSGEEEVGARQARTLLGDHDDHGYEELARCVSYEPECGNPSVLVITPPYEIGKLIRSDDPIDYAISTMQGVGTAVTHLKHGIGIHQGEWMDRRTGVQISREFKPLIQMLKGNPELASELDDECRNIWGYDRGSRKALFEGSEHVIAHAVQLVPDSVRLLAEHGNLFTDPDVWKQLKPVVYTYWG